MSTYPPAESPSASPNGAGGEAGQWKSRARAEALRGI
jgi:hypothetical protein